MASILFIVYDYPPILSPESIQLQRRALTLANNGHKIYILTSHKNTLFEFLDLNLLVEHENIKLINTDKPIFEKALNVFYKLLDITDRKHWWRNRAIKQAKKIILGNKIDILYSHSTPLVDHVVGLKIKKVFPSLKWVAHFSDPWTLNPYKSYKFHWQYFLNRKLEERVLCSCDKLTVTSEKTKELLVNDFEFVRNKTYVLPHVFDETYFNMNESINERKIVVHTGNIYGLRTIKYFLEALKEANLNNIEFHFYGKIKDSEIKLIDKFNLNNIVKVFPQIPYLKSLEIISKANYLMVIDAPLKNSPFFPSKLADYIGAKKSIIALTSKNSTTTDILKHISNDKFIASSDSKIEIGCILNNLDCIEDDYKNIEYYSMKNYSLLEEVFEK